MFRFLGINKQWADILATIVFALGSIFNFIEYYSEESKKMDMYGGVLFGIMAIIKATDVIGYYKKKKVE